MEALTIGRLAKAAGVSVETVRYYERRGLLEQPERRGGYRHYSAADVERLESVRRAKTFGFTLSEINELLAAGDVLAAARAKLAHVEEERRQLAQRAERLTRLVTVCRDGSQNCASLTL